VEVIGIIGGVIRVAKVTSDYQYDVLGVALNPRQRDMRIGDVASVVESTNQLELV
jgi:hypothetical protein